MLVPCPVVYALTHRAHTIWKHLFHKLRVYMNISLSHKTYEPLSTQETKIRLTCVYLDGERWWRWWWQWCGRQIEIRVVVHWLRDVSTSKRRWKKGEKKNRERMRRVWCDEQIEWEDEMSLWYTSLASVEPILSNSIRHSLWFAENIRCDFFIRC